MRPEDLAAVIELERAGFPQPWPEQAIAGLLEGGGQTAWVARDEHRVIGYAALAVDGRHAHVDSITVAGTHRRQGVGRALMITLITGAERRGAASLRLEVAMSNAQARNLYRRLGFNLIGVRRRYYGEEDALIMELRLSGKGDSSVTAFRTLRRLA